MILHRGDPIVCPLTKAEIIYMGIGAGQPHIHLNIGTRTLIMLPDL